MLSDYVLPLDYYLYTWYSSCVLRETTYLSGPTCAPMVIYLCGYTCALATCLHGRTCALAGVEEHWSVQADQPTPSDGEYLCYSNNSENDDVKDSGSASPSTRSGDSKFGAQIICPDTTGLRTMDTEDLKLDSEHEIEVSMVDSGDAEATGGAGRAAPKVTLKKIKEGEAYKQSEKKISEDLDILRRKWRTDGSCVSERVALTLNTNSLKCFRQQLQEHKGALVEAIQENQAHRLYLVESHNSHTWEHTREQQEADLAQLLRLANYLQTATLQAAH